jgi:hypothetical protein
MSSNGKGDNPRPLSISVEEYANNFERTFGSKKTKMEQRIQELQNDINAVREKLDNCEYSGLPATSSYNEGE